MVDAKTAGDYDVCVFGIPLDAGTTYRTGTRFGPQGVRKISAIYGTYFFEMGVDLREKISMADLGDVFVIPANIEKAFEQISRAVSHAFRSGTFPVMIGGDHSIGYPCVRGITPVSEARVSSIPGAICSLRRFPDAISCTIAAVCHAGQSPEMSR